MSVTLPSNLNIGDRVRGYVVYIAPFGAFIDFGEWQGLIRIPEISWSPIHHPSDVLTIGQEVETEVLYIDRERNQVSLSIKRCQENP
jgi:small subunit ribosomal protein S1